MSRQPETDTQPHYPPCDLARQLHLNVAATFWYLKPRGVRRVGGSRVWPGSGTDFMLYNFRYANSKQRLALCQPGEVLRCHLRGNTHTSTHTHRYRDKHTRCLTLNPARGGYAIFTTIFFACSSRCEGCTHTHTHSMLFRRFHTSNIYAIF